MQIFLLSFKIGTIEKKIIIFLRKKFFQRSFFHLFHFPLHFCVQNFPSHFDIDWQTRHKFLVFMNFGCLKKLRIRIKAHSPCHNAKVRTQFHMPSFCLCSHAWSEHFASKSRLKFNSILAASNAILLLFRLSGKIPRLVFRCLQTTREFC